MVMINWNKAAWIMCTSSQMKGTGTIKITKKITLNDHNTCVIGNYKLGAHYCRQQWEKGGIAIFVHNSLDFSNIDTVQHCEDQDIEICAVKLLFGDLNICVLTLYRAPLGDLTFCRSNLDPYCMGRKAAFFQWAFKFTYVPVHFSAFRPAGGI
jgi:hypothetical protein